MNLFDSFYHHETTEACHMSFVSGKNVRSFFSIETLKHICASLSVLIIVFHVKYKEIKAVYCREEFRI